jgi:hypothetical protein
MPGQRLSIYLFRGAEADLELHRLVDLRWDQASTGRLSLQAEAEIYPDFGCGLHPCERRRGVKGETYPPSA